MFNNFRIVIFFVSRVIKQADIDAMREHLMSKGVICRDIKMTSHEDSTFNSFRLSISYSDVSKIKEPDFWPKGIWIRKWHEPSQQPQ